MSDKIETAASIEGLPIFGSSKKEIFNILLKKYIDVFFLEIFLEAKLSEFSSRTIEAEHASSKSKDIIKSLQLSFVKERRKSSTQGQLESFIAHKIL